MQMMETKEEIVAKANSMSDFLKMEYLEKCAMRVKDTDVLRYCYGELMKLYEGRIMYSDALKYLAKLQSLATFSRDKFQLYEKEIDICIKAGNYERVADAFKSATKLVGEIDAINLRRKIIKWYQLEAQKFEQTNKQVSALRVYERLIPLLTDTERNETKKKLLVIYKKLGKVKESIELEKGMYR
ncbi:MAG: hypothetical protein RL557_1091 [archaeon]|jgi:tetratricopeptide (TPR) repeat protein